MNLLDIQWYASHLFLKKLFWIDPKPRRVRSSVWSTRFVNFEGVEMENTEKNIYSDVVPRFPEHLQETMSKLPLETQQRLYLDIFKPLDFYELLFEYFKKNDGAQNSCDSEDKRWMLNCVNLCNEKFAGGRESVS